MAKISKPILYTLIVGVGALIYVYSSGPDPTATAPKRTTVKRVVGKPKVGINVIPYDYKVKFASLNETPKNTFKPLVIRESALQFAPPDPSKLSGLLTGGEPNWGFTGVVEVNGTRMALLENDATGEGVYVKSGDRWKKVVVSSISDDTLMLIGPDTAPARIKLGEGGTKTNTNTVAANPTPVQPPLQGSIGTPGATPGGMATLPGATMNGMTALPGVGMNDMSMQPSTGFGGGGGGRRRRRGQ